MESLLKYLEQNCSVFEMFNGSLGSFVFPSDIKELIYILMIKANRNYLEVAQKYGKDPKAIDGFYIEKDPSGKCYLKIVGVDDRTTLIIYHNNDQFKYYKELTGKKIDEDDFIKLLDVYQKEKFEKAKKLGIAKRFLNPSPNSINAIEEWDAVKLVEYYKYLGNCYLGTISTKRAFDEPETSDRERATIRRNIEGIASPRKNEVIDYNLRRQELLKYKPMQIINFVGRKMGEEIDVYVYEIGDYIMAVAEPRSGESYTKIMNLGMIDKNNREMISNNIEAALEASEEIVLADDAIIRKSHTTFEIFKKNLEVLFNNEDDMYRLVNDIENSKSVYRK